MGPARSDKRKVRVFTIRAFGRVASAAAIRYNTATFLLSCALTEGDIRMNVSLRRLLVMSAVVALSPPVSWARAQERDPETQSRQILRSAGIPVLMAH